MGAGVHRGGRGCERVGIFYRVVVCLASHFLLTFLA